MNEDPTEALIRELKEQNEKLKAQLASGVVTDADIDVEEDDNLSPAGDTGLFFGRFFTQTLVNLLMI